MADEGRPADAQGIEYRNVVARPGFDVVTIPRLAGRHEPAAGDSDDMKAVGELLRELVEDMRVVTQAGEQHHGLRLVLAAPIHHLQPHAGLHLDEPRLVRRGIPACGRRIPSAPFRLVDGASDPFVEPVSLGRGIDAEDQQQRECDCRLAKTLGARREHHGNSWVSGGQCGESSSHRRSFTPVSRTSR